MTQKLWDQVDDYFGDLLHPQDAALDATLRSCAAANLPPISVAPNQGRLLQILALACRAQKILEIGTLAGYSTICMARALPPGGKLISLEIDARHAAIARENIARANLAAIAEVRLGRALDLLPTLQSESPFDVIFIDADKPSNADYFRWALKLSHPGTLIIIDNVVREGAILNPASTDTSVQGVRRLAEAIATETRVTATALQTVGSKGYDGLILAVVNSNAT